MGPLIQINIYILSHKDMTLCCTLRLYFSDWPPEGDKDRPDSLLSRPAAVLDLT